MPAAVSRDEVLAMQRALEDVFVSDAVERYVVDLVQASRADHRVALGASPILVGDVAGPDDPAASLQQVTEAEEV